MARIRSIKPDFFRHEELQEIQSSHPHLNPMLAFPGLWVIADRVGRFQWNPKVLHLDILPFLAFDMGECLDLLAAHGFIKRYEVDGKAYGYIPSWSQHQTGECLKKEKVRFPDPPGAGPEPIRKNSITKPEPIPSQSRTGPEPARDQSGKEKEKEKEKEVISPLPPWVGAARDAGGVEEVAPSLVDAHEPPLAPSAPPQPEPLPKVVSLVPQGAKSPESDGESESAQAPRAKKRKLEGAYAEADLGTGLSWFLLTWRLWLDKKGSPGSQKVCKEHWRAIRQELGVSDRRMAFAAWAYAHEENKVRKGFMQHLETFIGPGKATILQWLERGAALEDLVGAEDELIAWPPPTAVKKVSGGHGEDYGF